MLEYLSGSVLYTLVKDGFGVLRRRKRRLTPAQIMDLRTKWREEFQEKINEKYRRKVGLDVVVRDMSRIDVYPGFDKRSGISAWFKAGLMATYNRGVQLGLTWDEIKLNAAKSRWEKADHRDPEAVKVILMGLVPYENIHAVEWDGDEFYYDPHIYCYFEGKAGGPYENLVYCEERYLHERPYYVEVVPSKDLYRNDRTVAARFKRWLRLRKLARQSG